jgi:hypothetical protein
MSLAKRMWEREQEQKHLDSDFRYEQYLAENLTQYINQFKPNTMSFLPTNYEQPRTGGNYMKFQKGENKFRILSKPILGFEDWKDNKPLRFRMDSKPLKPIDPKKSIKHFWAMIVWNYQDSQIQILEITQSTIQSAIRNLAADEDWGSPFNYDIKVTRKGEGMETEYSVIASPKKPVTDEIKEALLNKPVNLEALFEGEDPFVL